MDLKISKSFTPAEKQRIKSLGRTIDEALRRSRAGKVDTEMLKDLGMTAEQFAGFVKRYTDRFDTPTGGKRLYLRPKVPFGVGA